MGARPPPLKIKNNSSMVLFPSLLGPFLHVEGLFSSFRGHFLQGGWRLFSFYVEIYLHLPPLTKISAFVYAFTARVVPNILEHIC